MKNILFIPISIAISSTIITSWIIIMVACCAKRQSVEIDKTAMTVNNRDSTLQLKTSNIKEHLDLSRNILIDSPIIIINDSHGTTVTMTARKISKHCALEQQIEQQDSCITISGQTSTIELDNHAISKIKQHSKSSLSVALYCIAVLFLITPIIILSRRIHLNNK